MRFSNTYFFYRRGWAGVNIDANPGSMRRFNLLRRRDTNIEVAVGREEGRRSFHIYSEPAFNRFATDDAGPLSSGEPTACIEVDVLTPNTILESHVPPGTTIDLLCIDVEGHELAILEMLDWKLYRPSIIVVEILNTSMVELTESQVGRFLASVEYIPVAKCLHSVLYAERQFATEHSTIAIPEARD